MIRPYTDADLDAVLSVWYSASKVGHPFMDEDFLTQERKALAEEFLPNSDTWVYERNGQVVGFISMNGDEVGGIFVGAGFHGQGIGRTLMDHARGQHKCLELDVFKENEVGRRFYTRYGFVLERAHKHAETGRIMLRLRLPC